MTAMSDTTSTVKAHQAAVRDGEPGDALAATTDLLAVAQVMCPEIDEENQYVRPVEPGDVWIDDAYHGHIILARHAGGLSTKVAVSYATEGRGQASLQVKTNHEQDGVEIRSGHGSLAVIPNCGNVVDVIGRS